MVTVVVIVGSLAMLMAAGCGGDSTETPSSATVATTATSSGAGVAGGQGTAVAKEILATFDEIVAKAADLAKAKPEPAVLKTQLEELYTTYTAKMTELNGKYLGLRDSDIAQFGECNTYLGENRGKHVTAKDNTLTPAMQYYNLQLGDKEIVSLLSQKPVELLDIAVKQN
jgi:hypothetical protein